jgi:hypothetical protein
MGDAAAYTTQRAWPANDELTFVLVLVLVLIIVIESQEKGQRFATLKR